MDIRENLVKYLADFDFDKEAAESVLIAFDRILACDGLGEELAEYIEAYKNGCLDYDALCRAAEEAAAISGIHPSEASFIYTASLCNFALPYYERAGLDKNVWYDSMMDFKWKIREHKKLHGIWGTNTAAWHKRFFSAERMAFGRLQFNLLECERDFKGKSVEVAKGQTVVTIHIPTDDRTPFSRENRVKSYKRAAEYFARFFEGGKFVFRCGTWLLHPEHRNILPEGSNIRSFLDDFELDGDSFTETSSNIWRLFYVNSWDGNPDSLPEETSLMKIYKNFIRSGGRLGSMVGFFPSDKIG